MRGRAANVCVFVCVSHVREHMCRIVMTPTKTSSKTTVVRHADGCLVAVHIGTSTYGGARDARRTRATPVVCLVSSRLRMLHLLHIRVYYRYFYFVWQRAVGHSRKNSPRLAFVVNFANTFSRVGGREFERGRKKMQASFFDRVKRGYYFFSFVLLYFVSASFFHYYKPRVCVHEYNNMYTHTHISRRKFLPLSNRKLSQFAPVQSPRFSTTSLYISQPTISGH